MDHRDSNVDQLLQFGVTDTDWTDWNVSRVDVGGVGTSRLGLVSTVN